MWLYFNCSEILAALLNQLSEEVSKIAKNIYSGWEISKLATMLKYFEFINDFLIRYKK